MYRDREACYRALQTRDSRFDGRFFTAVRTTGIYCRPICPARPPKLCNVTFHPSAAAAEVAGYRPCLRCRPETTPDLAAWHGTSTTVGRALSLIAAGALDGSDVETLATRLGVGERQLRRLFQRHLGASPNAVAQTRRSLFAKQLITETPLRMTEVAMAAGFGSLRRFNDAMRTLYGRPPLSLRRGSKSAEPDQAVTLRLAYKAPYDWPAIIRFLAARAIPGVEFVQPGVYARTITLGAESGSLDVRPDQDRPALIATIRFPNITRLPIIVSRIRRIFDLGADPAIIGDHLSADPYLAVLVAARPGLRVPGAWDGFELAIRAILGQQITVAAATKLAGKLAAHYGTVLPESGRCLFPHPDRLLGDDLGLTLGMPRSRAATIAGMAATAMEHPGLFEPGHGLEAGIARLTALPGIGAWTAHYIAMRALREPDAFPAADIGLMRALATPAGRPNPAQLLARAEAWRPWRAYAALHLWNSSALDQETRLDAAA